jgi:hypothetical protein
LRETAVNLARPTPAQFEGAYCVLTIERPTPGLILVKFRGTDVGEFGDRPFREMARGLAEGDDVELFIDASGGRAASIDVSNDWALWLRTHRNRFLCIHMLTATKFIELSAELVRRFAGLENRMRLYTSASAFRQALELASEKAGDSPASQDSS